MSISRQYSFMTNLSRNTGRSADEALHQKTVFGSDIRFPGSHPGIGETETRVSVRGKGRKIQSVDALFIKTPEFQRAAFTSDVTRQDAVPGDKEKRPMLGYANENGAVWTDTPIPQLASAPAIRRLGSEKENVGLMVRHADTQGMLDP
jgi:hypothetical protein